MENGRLVKFFTTCINNDKRAKNKDLRGET